MPRVPAEPMAETPVEAAPAVTKNGEDTKGNWQRSNQKTDVYKPSTQGESVAE